MEEFFLEWIPNNAILFALISIIINIFIAISGVLPSAFLTAANIAVFDFKIGLIVSIVGEAFGAIVSFILYRKGIKKLSNHIEVKNQLLNKLQHTKGWKAIGIVLILRILPFVPSGVVTLTAAYSQMGIYSFSIASTIGKIPSLVIEAYSVDQVLNLSKEWQIGLLSFTLLLFASYFIWKKRKNSDL